MTKSAAGLLPLLILDGLLGVRGSKGTSAVAKNVVAFAGGGDRGRALAHLSNLWFTGTGSLPSTCDFNCSDQA